MEQHTNEITDEIALDDNQIICALTNVVKANKGKEPTLQSLILMLNEEYRFDTADMERDYTFSYEDKDNGKKKRMKVDLVVFESGKPHDDDFIIRACIVQDDKTKVKDAKKGTEATLEVALEYLPDCEFGVWTNGDVFHFLQKDCDKFDNLIYNDISDFPGPGQTMDDLERSDRITPRKPANDSLVRTFKRCHDYIYANEGMKKTAFWELLNLIFCKIYDEKRRFMPSEFGNSYRRHFWVGVKEQNSDEGLKAVAKRIKDIFENLKSSEIFSEVFDGNEQIGLSDRGLAYVAGELSKYSFLDATVDVKGTAYETIVGDTLKKEAGQFFTPRNVVKCMVQMLDPDANTRILDPACGSGGFLVMALDHVRHKIAANLYPELDTPENKLRLEAKYNTYQVNEAVREYAEAYIYGFDFDPDLKKAARMNMVMSGDGHANIFNINSLEYPNGSKEDIGKINTRFKGTGALGQFDMIFTNPPFGSKVPVDFEISKHYELGHNWTRDADGKFVDTHHSSSSVAPEILFIEQCYKFLKRGGKMAIVLPDGILGNPNTEYVRSWILYRFKILASIDLPVETFLPQVGVQASLLFLQKKKSQTEDLEYDVFMAIAEAVGKDRRGAPVFERDEDGAEILFDDIKETLSIEDGIERIKRRKVKVKRLDDDLPKIKDTYLEFLKNGKV